MLEGVLDALLDPLEELVKELEAELEVEIEVEEVEHLRNALVMLRVKNARNYVARSVILNVNVLRKDLKEEEVDLLVEVEGKEKGEEGE